MRVKSLYAFATLGSMSTCTHAFSTSIPSNKIAFYSGLDTKLYSDAAPSDVDSENIMNPLMQVAMNAERDELKTKLLKLCASYDRGFGASPKSRKEVEEIIKQLGEMNPTPVDAARGIDGESGMDMEDVPLKGAWRMIWTTALDVLNLAASPVASPGAIYQVIDPPIATNIIDFIPRFQSLLPTGFPSSLVRAEVKTRASLRRNNSNRVGLNFEAVKLYPVEVLGMKSDIVPPFNLNLPKIKIEDLPGVDPNNAPGFFDVVYLDGDMLIIKQNAPGGYFVSIKVDNYDP
mmetsp:Transcript_15557/g.29344  ORF Transcript_15557/g.29344 Transcript_15557/m.29344 type:complete len:289 (-) Transcript_15557:90-956(-)